MRIQVVRVLLELILRNLDGFADAAELEVQFCQAVLQIGGVRVSVECELVLLDRLRGIIGAALRRGQVLVNMREAVMVISRTRPGRRRRDDLRRQRLRLRTLLCG